MPRKEAMPNTVFDENVEAVRDFESRLNGLMAEISERTERLEMEDGYMESSAIAASLRLMAISIGGAAATASAILEEVPTFFDRQAEREVSLTRVYDGLSEEDREALRKSASDLSDIDPRQRAQIDAGFARAYERARLIGEGKLNPLSGGE